MSHRKSWIVRELEREARLQRRQLSAQQRQWAKNQRALDKVNAKAAQLAQAQDEVARFDEEREHLLLLHRDCGRAVKWAELLSQAEPPPPTRNLERTQVANERLESYVPTFFDKVLFRTKSRRGALKEALLKAQSADDESYREAQALHAERLERFEWETRVASGVVNRDVTAYREALQGLAPFSELYAVGVRVVVKVVRPDLAAVDVCVDRDKLPDEEIKLTSTGKATKKALSQSARFSLHQQYVASCALRVARELFAALPVTRAIVNVVENGVNRSTGHRATTTLLATSCEREVLQGFDFENLDPVAALENIPSRMTFRKTTGLEPVDPITEDESFMTMARS